MKKLLVALLVIVLTALVWIVTSGKRFEPPFSDAFPAGAIAYVGVKDGGAFAHDLGNSNFWKALRGIESLRAAPQIPGGRDAVAAAPAALSRILGEAAAVAVYGEKSPFGPAALAAVRSPEARGALRSLALTQPGARSAGTHGGMELHVFELPGMPGLKGMYAADEHAGFAAVSSRDPEGLVKAAIDLRAGKGDTAPLRGDREFASGIGKPPRDAKGALLACGWMGPEAVKAASRSRAAAAGLAVANAPAVAQALAAATEIPVVAAGGYLYRDRGLSGMFRSRVDRTRLTDAQRAVWPGAPEGLGALALAPKGTILVSAARIRNAAAAWDAFTATSNPVGAAVADWLAACGIDFAKDVAPWMGDEISVQLSGVQVGGLFPLVSAELIVSVRDRRAAERTVLRLMEQAAGGGGAAAQQPWAFLRPDITRGEHRGVAVTTLGYPIPGLSPSFGFIGDRLVIGLDRSSVHGIIDTAKGAREPLSSDPVFAEMRAAAPARLNSFIWMDGEGALRAGEGVLGWALAVKRLARSVSDEPPSESETRLEADIPRIFAAAHVFRAAMAATACGRDTVDRYFAVRVRDL